MASTGTDIALGMAFCMGTFIAADMVRVLYTLLNSYTDHDSGVKDLAQDGFC